MLTPNFYTKKDEESADFGRFIMEPLPLSFGNSVGNALRRTLLSSLEGAAVTQVKIKNAPHFFTTLTGVKESVLDIVLNLKQLRFQATPGTHFKIRLEGKGAKKVYAKDIDSEVKITNGDLYLAEITDSKGSLEIEAIVESGVGSVAAEDQSTKETGFFAIDAYFSPVTKVNFKVEEARVGRKTNYDRLVLEVWTDATVAPSEALRQAASILSSHFNHILSGNDNVVSRDEEQKVEDGKREVDQKLAEIIIDELNLPSRVINALLRENIETVADLISVGKDKLIGVKGLGKKSFVLIEDELKKLGISLEENQS